MTLKVFVVGYKNHAQRVIKNLVSSKLCSHIYVFHPDKGKLDEIENFSSLVLKTYNFVNTMKCSCIFICSPSNTHFYYLKELLRLSLEHGHLPYIYCEKPVVVSSNEIQWLENNFSNFSKKLKVGFNFLCSDFILEASRLIKTESSGKPISAFFQTSHGLAAKKNFSNNWRAHDTNPFSQILGNLAVHFIHASQYLFGKVKNYLLLEQNTFSSINPDTTSLLLKHENGVQSHIFCSYATVFSKRFSIYFTDGFLDQSHKSLVLMGPRETYNDAGEFTIPQKQILSEQSVERDTSLKQSIINFLLDVINEREFDPLGLIAAIDASKIVIEISTKPFYHRRQ